MMSLAGMGKEGRQVDIHDLIESRHGLLLKVNANTAGCWVEHTE